MAKIIDLDRIKAADAKLKKLVKDNPHRMATQDSEQWPDSLELLDELTDDSEGVTL